MERVGLMWGFLNSTNAITIAAVYFMEKVWIPCQKSKYHGSPDILRIPKVDLDCRYPKYHNFLEVSQSLYMLEISAILLLENIYDYQGIYIKE